VKEVSGQLTVVVTSVVILLVRGIDECGIATAKSVARVSAAFNDDI